jgi:GT2 family glycosyltransferase
VPWPPDVEVAVVAHNNLATLPDTIAALVDAGCSAERITIVDIASSDGTGDWLAREQPRIRVRPLDRNEGPNPARNVGITEARTRLVLLMDADVRLLPDTVAPLYAAMRSDASIKIATPIVVRADRPDVIQYAGGALHYMCEAVNPWVGRPIADRGSSPLDVGAAPACALLIDRAAAIEIGLFDERYFMGKDDGDFIHRMHMAGYRIRELPESLVLHDTRQRSDWMFYYQIRNRWHFILKNYELRTILALLPALIVHEPLQFGMLAAKGHAWTYIRAIGGLLRFLPTLPRDRALARRIRRRHDRDVLTSAPMVVRDDVLGTGAVRRAKDLYDRWLDAYWRLLTRTVLAR